jgi:hypothetical protein
LFSRYPASHRDDGILATWLRQILLPQGSVLINFELRINN